MHSGPADDLFALPLDAFVSARDARAKALAKDGHDLEAKRVAALKKPTVPAWALDQLARKHPRAVEPRMRAM